MNPPTILPGEYNPNIHDVYSLAVYIVFPAALLVFSAGYAYRVARLLLALRRKRWVADRERAGLLTLILGAINVYIYPPLFALFRNRKDFILGLVGVHFIGLIPLIFLLGQHVAFFSYYIPFYALLWSLAIPLSSATGWLPVASRLQGVSSPPASTLWGPLTVIMNGDFLTLVVGAAIGFKIGERVYATLREGHRPSDLVMYLHLALIILTGFLAAHHSGLPWAEGVVAYRAILGAHIMLAALFLALIPFTKYWHFVFGMFFGKFVEWVDRTWMRGAALEGGRLTPPKRRVRRG